MSDLASQLLIFFDIALTHLPNSPIHVSTHPVYLNQKKVNVYQMHGSHDHFYGLMGVRQWSVDQALQFEYVSRSFWMRNVPHSLDMVFFDQYGCVLSFQKAVPYHHAPIMAPKEAWLTWELGGGAIEYYHLRQGDCFHREQ